MTGGSARDRRRLKRLVGRVFGDARRGAQTLLTPVPIEPIAPVPPTAVSSESKLLKHSPFAMGFYGAIGVLVALGLASAVMQVQSILILVVLGLFLALGLSPVVDFLARRRVPRGLAVFIVTVSAIGIIALGFTALVPILTEQAQSLVRNLPALLDNLRQNRQIADWDQEFKIIDRVRSFLTSGTLLQNLFGGIWGAGRILANVVFSVIMTLVLTIYFLASLPSIKEIIYHLAPASRRPRARYLADEIFSGVSGYITGMFFIVTVASVASFIYMNIAGLGQYSLALAFVVALFCFIPIIGSSLAMVAVAIVAFATSPTLGIVTIIYFLVYQQFDAYVLYPNILKRTVKVPGVLVILSAIIGGALLGIIGAVIAIPTAAAILLLYREVVQPHLDAT
ncbi:AI-2E family transporter [Tessaracoccus antarcticus]|uniref:AI-2E family transporter n=2 Tax=Tessaracoccus antarcticus TaxID=2479848 RepID=A0A3M0GD22_9ACTN|nr:AI-2E family transporter [Tessaracoccus antarcticus]